MKKFLKILFLISIFLLSGCNGKNTDKVLDELEDKLKNSKTYYVEGVMEIINHEDTYTYDVKVSYQKNDYYKIQLINNLNKHEQVILRNNDGVYVVTPSLNKSFKFQSDWPYNNSQVYLLNSILEDLKEDEDRRSEQNGESYYFSSSVNYPNNRSLVSQNVYFSKNGQLEKVEVVDKDGNVQITMSFKVIEFDKKFDKNYFELSSILKINDSNNNSGIGKKNENSSNDIKEEVKDDNINNDEKLIDSNDSKTKTTASIDDVVYPMYLPDNTYLTSKEVIDTDEGQRLIMTFDGDSSFVLVEEVSNYVDEGLIIPVHGDFDFFKDVIGVIGNKSLSWYSNGIEYYMVSDTLEVAELIEIARSVSVLPVSK